MQSPFQISYQPGQILYPEQQGHPRFQQFQAGQLVPHSQAPNARMNAPMVAPMNDISMTAPHRRLPASQRSEPARASIPELKPEDDNLDDDEDDDLNIDTANMTQEEKNELKQQRKLRKMNREKLKRLKLNNQFDLLCSMLAINRSTRVEKLAVLNETIRTVCSLKAENDGMRAQSKRVREELRRRRESSGQQQPAAPQQVQPQQQVKMQQQFYAPQPLTKQPQSQPQFHQMKYGQQQFQKMKQEPSSFGWQAQAQPQDDDLDFAFGDDDDDFWTNDGDSEKEQWQGQWPAPQFPGMDILAAGLPPFCAQPPEADDSIDMFLQTDDPSDLLCF